MTTTNHNADVPPLAQQTTHKAATSAATQELITNSQEMSDTVRLLENTIGVRVGADLESA